MSISRPNDSDLYAFLIQYFRQSEYAKAIWLPIDTLARWVLNAIRKATVHGGDCIATSAMDSSLNSVGVIQKDEELSKLSHSKDFYYCHWYFLGSSDLFTAELIDRHMNGTKGVLRLKCNTTPYVRRVFEMSGYHHYYTASRFIHNSRAQDEPLALPDYNYTITKVNEATREVLSILQAHQSSERYHHPHIDAHTVNQYYAAWWKNRLKKSESIIFQATTAQHTIIALAILTYPRHMHGLTGMPLYTLDYFFIDASVRRQGVGAWFLAAIISLYPHATIETCCSAQNQAIISLLTRNNFQLVEQSDYFAKDYSKPIPARP